MPREVVAIDGLAGSGKSSISKELARRLGYIHLNTGLFYRAATYLAWQADVPASDETSLLNLLKSHSFELVLVDGNTSDILIDGIPGGKKLHSESVSNRVSEYSAVPKLREFFYEHQRNAFPGQNLVAEGRDMGTVVFPDAQVKFFVIADADVRARRRLGQQNTPLTPETLETMKADLLRRDKIDTDRKVAPTVMATGAKEIDNSTKALVDIVSELTSQIQARSRSRGMPR